MKFGMEKVRHKLCAELHANCAAKDACYLKNAKVGGRYKRALYKVLSSFGKVTGHDVSSERKKYSRRCDDRVSLKIFKLKIGKSKPPPLLGKMKERNDKASTIIMILESPDVSEYKNASTPGATAEPARGRTGKEIRKHIVEQLMADNDFKQWRLHLINPVQYSCSLGGLLSSRKKDDLFKSLFNGDIEKCFRNRLVAACGNRQHVVINCCTNIGRTQINKILRELGVRFLQMDHPSSWWRHNDIPNCFVNGSGERKPFSAELLRTVVVPGGVDVGNV